MVSGLDLLGGQKKQASGIDLLGQEATEVKSGLDLLAPIVPATEIPPEPVAIKSQRGRLRTTPSKYGYLGDLTVSPYERSMGIGTVIDEFGRSVDEVVETDNRQVNVGKIASETLKGLGTLATRPMEVIRGALDFGLSVPGFLTGILDATGSTVKEIMDQVIIGQTLDLDQVYNAASQGMQRSMEFFEPGKELIVGEPSPESQLAVQVAMAPLTGLSAAGHKVANWEGFKNYPNIRGAARFTGDIAGLITMGLLFHGPRARADFAKHSEEVVKKAEKIIEKEQAIEGIPNEVIKQAQQKVLELEKKQLEIEAARLAKKAEEEALIRAKAEEQGEAIIKERGIPVRRVELTDEIVFEDIRKYGERIEKAKERLGKAKTKAEQKKWSDEIDHVRKLISIAEEALTGEAKPITEDVPSITHREIPVKGFNSPYTDEPITHLRIKSYPAGYEQVHTSNISTGSVSTKTKIVDGEIVGPGKVSGGLENISNTLDPYWIEGRTKSGKWEEISRYNDLKSAEEGLKGLGPKIIKVSKKAEPKAKPVKEISEPVIDLEFSKKETARLNKELSTNRTKQSKIDINSEEYRDLKIEEEELLEQIKAHDIEPEVVTDLDIATGTEPQISQGTKSPFFQSPEEANTFSGIYAERMKSVMEDPELFTQKLINDVNKWYHGDEGVDIAKTRDGLSTMAARADELRGDFITGVDFSAWKETVSEAAVWARGLERSKIRQADEFKVYTYKIGNELKKVIEDPEGNKLIQGIDTVGDVYYEVEGKVSEMDRFVNITKEGDLELNESAIREAFKHPDRLKIERTIEPRTVQEKHQRYRAIADMVGTSGGSSSIPVLEGYKSLFTPTEFKRLSEYFQGKGAQNVFDGKETVENVAKNAEISDLVGYDKKEVGVIDRQKIERTGGPGVQLNMMIPLDQIPNIVLDMLAGSKKLMEDFIDRHKGIKASKLYRNKELFDKTGYWLGKDGKWRYEIDDSKMNVKLEILQRSEDAVWEGKLSDVIEYPNLFATFPEIKGLKIKIDPKHRSYGTYFPSTDSITMDRFRVKTLAHELQHRINDKAGAFRGTTLRNAGIKGNLKEIVKRLEIIHKESLVKEAREGAKKEADRIRRDLENDTGNPSDIRWFYDFLEPFIRNTESVELHDKVYFPIKPDIKGIYYKTPGEMESRLVEARLNMSAKERKAKPPWETLDEMLEKEHLKDPSQFKSYSQYQDPGTKLYSGIDPTEIVKQAKRLKAGAEDYWQGMERAYGMKKFKPLVAAKMLREEFNRDFVDRSGNIRNELLNALGQEGYEIIQKMYLSKGASSISTNMLKQMRKEVYDGLSRKQKKILDAIIKADRLIDISSYKPSFKFPKDSSRDGKIPDKAIEFRASFQQKFGLSDAETKMLNDKAAAYFEWMKKPLKDLLDAEIISQQEYDNLVSHNYRKIKLVDVYDKRYVHKTGKRTRTVYDSGIEALARGRDTDIFEPSSEVMALEVFNRTYGRILNNAANKTLLDLAKRDPMNPFARTKEVKGTNIPSGWNRLFVYEGGERKSVYISPEMSKEWITSSPETTYKFAQLARHTLGSSTLRTFATGINWGFAMANLPRDVMHTWFTARTWQDGKWKGAYSPHAPVFSMQIGNDLASVFSDAWHRKGRYQDYINEGGGMEFLTHQGRLFKRGRHLDSSIDKLYNFMGYLGETTEVMTRLAIRDRVIKKRAKQQGLTLEQARKNKKITTEATFAARDYMDFGQGGGIAKAVDNGIPYLNASIQGTRGMFRSFKPGSGTAMSSTYKLAQFAALTAGLTIAAWKLAPRSMKDLEGNIDTQNNLCIPLGDRFAFVDKYGDTRYLYFKIPLDPGQRFFKTFFEGATNKWLGKEVDADKIVAALKEQAPVDMTALPPTISGVLGYIMNKDFWLNEDIWKGTEKPLSYPESKLEFNLGDTPQAFIDLGELTGLSPERTKYAVEELVTSGTVWSYLLGMGYDELLSDLPESKRQQHLAMVLARMPVVKRFLGVTNPYSKFARKAEKYQQEAVIEDFVPTNYLDTLVDGYLYEGNVSRKEVFAYIDQYKDKDTHDMLIDRFKYQEVIKDLPNKSFWYRLRGMRLEAKARMFKDRLENSTPEERTQLWNEYAIIAKAGGVASEGFRREFSGLHAR